MSGTGGLVDGVDAMDSVDAMDAMDDVDVLDLLCRADLTAELELLDLLP